MNENMKYSEAISNLEKIISDIQNGNLEIDVLNDKLSQARELIAFCRAKLYNVDEELKAMLENMDSGGDCE